MCPVDAYLTAHSQSSRLAPLPPPLPCRALPELKGPVTDTALVGYARGVLRTAPAASLFLGTGTATFVLSAATESGFHRRLW